MSEYWRESFGEILCNFDLWECMTAEQRDQVADAIADAASVEWEYSGAQHIPDPRDERIAQLEKAATIESRKIHCKECSGTGRITSPCGVSHYAISECWKCRGEGRHL